MKKLLLLFVIAVILMGLTTSTFAARYFVKINGSDGNDGLSWTTAKATISAALNIASATDEIWVAKGIYHPNGSGRNATLTLKKGVTVYGSFAGAETSIAQRNLTLNESIIDGDIGVLSNASDNAYHVITGAENSTINGFTITNGNANGSGINVLGAGLYFPIGTMSIRNCSFELNIAAEKGGAVYLGKGKTVLDNCYFSKNKAKGPNSRGGGAIFMSDYCKAEISNSTFDQNIADREDHMYVAHGGAIYNSSSALGKITKCVFTKNSAEYGGAIDASGAPIIDDCTFDGNWSFTGEDGNFGGRGGAIFNYDVNSAPLISNCDFIKNSCPSFGGAIDNDSSSKAVITNSTFTENSAGYGGGINNWQSQSTIKNCIFTDNTAALTGGGIGIFHCSTGLISGCTFDGNSSSDNGGEGGAIGFFGGTNYNIDRCVIYSNTAGYGGGIYIRLSTPTISNCLILNNSSNSIASSNTSGGGIYILAASPTIMNCTIYGNNATEGAGIFTATMDQVANPSDVKIINTIVWGNTNKGAVTTQIVNTFDPSSLSGCYSKLSVKNSCVYNGVANIPNRNGATFVNLGGNTFTNPHFNSTTDLNGPDDKWATYDDGLRLVSLSPCIDTGTSTDAPKEDIVGIIRPTGIGIDMGAYEGDSSAPYVRINTPTSEPIYRTKLTTINVSGNAYSTKYLTSITYSVTGSTTTSGTIAVSNNWNLNSLALNKGVNIIEITATDANGKKGFDRIQITVVVPSVIYVKSNAAGANNGSSWVNAFKKLTDAINVSDEGDQIWVASGTFKPTEDNDRTKSFILKADTKLYGGFVGNETSLTQRNFLLNKTYLSGDIGIVGNNSDNSYHIVIGAASSVINGFTIISGNASDADYNSYASAVYINNISMEISNCYINNNNNRNGGAVYCVGFLAEPIIKNCKFYQNATEGSGGALVNAGGSSPQIKSCIFQENSSGAGWSGKGGGAIQNAGASALISECVFYRNTAKSTQIGGGANGGAIFNNGADGCKIINCIFAENESDLGGALFFQNPAKDSVINCTFAYNSAKQGGAAAMGYNPNPDIINNIFWGNIADESPEIYIASVESAGIMFKNNDIKGGIPSAGWGIVVDGGENLNVDPKFLNAASAIGPDEKFGTTDDGLILKIGSLCVDTGNAEDAPDIDILGVTRPQGSGIAMGAYESTALDDDINPSITITSPTNLDTYSTTNNKLNISGNASDDNSVIAVKWTSNAGSSGDCSGTTNWSATGINLIPGENIITVTAYDGIGNTKSDVLIVTYNAPPLPIILLPTNLSDYDTNFKTINLSGTSSAGTKKISWTSSTGGKGSAVGTTKWSVKNIKLNLGKNIITIIAADAKNITGSDTITINYTDIAAPTVKFKSPTSKLSYNTTKAILNISGSALDNEAVVEVKWKNQKTNATGLCIGTKSWKASKITLLPGINIIEVTAKDSSGNTAAAALSVSFTDKTKPKTTIITPTKSSSYSVKTDTITLSGVSFDDVGVASVSWVNSTGGSGICNGISNWTSQSIALKPGKNKIVITAKDASNNIGTDIISVNCLFK